MYQAVQQSELRLLQQLRLGCEDDIRRFREQLAYWVWTRTVPVGTDVTREGPWPVEVRPWAWVRPFARCPIRELQRALATVRERRLASYPVMQQAQAYREDFLQQSSAPLPPLNSRQLASNRTIARRYHDITGRVSSRLATSLEQLVLSGLSEWEAEAWSVVVAQAQQEGLPSLAAYPGNPSVGYGANGGFWTVGVGE